MWNCGWMGGLPLGIGNLFMGFGPMGGLFGLLILVLVIIFIVKLIRSATASPRAASDKSDSLGILKTRFASGEITEEEYKRMSDLLLRK